LPYYYPLLDWDYYEYCPQEDEFYTEDPSPAGAEKNYFHRNQNQTVSASRIYYYPTPKTILHITDIVLYSVLGEIFLDDETREKDLKTGNSAVQKVFK